MAEPDAAGHAPESGSELPAPEGSRSYTLADIQRDMDRATAPLMAAQRDAERSMAPVLAVARQYERDQRRIAAMVDKAIGPYLRTLAGPPSQKKAAPPPEDSERRRPPPAPAATAHAAPVFDASPADVSALVDTVSAEVWARLAGSLTGETAAFKEEILAKIAEEVRKAFAEAEGQIAKRPGGGRRHKRTVDGLTVSQWVAAMAAEDSSFRYLSCRAAAKLGPFSPSAVRQCEIWVQMKAQVEAEASEKAERAEAELADRRKEGEDTGGLRRSSTKYGVGKQRTTRKELEHERSVANFLREKGEQPEKKRAE